jgi:tetratricopeptide (TPR) repeat protein
VKAYDDGIKYFESRITEEQRTPEVILELGRLYAARGDIDQAVDAFRRALHANAFKKAEFSLRLTAAIQADLGADALAKFKEFAPEETLTRIDQHIGVSLLLAAGQFDESEKALRSLIDSAESDAEKAYLWIQLGLALGSQERYSESNDSYRKAVAIDPSSLWALNNLAYQLSDKLGDHAAAIPFARRAAVLAPDPPVLDTLGYVYLMNGQYDDAVGYLTRARRSDPTYVPAAFHLGETYRRMGRFDRAVSVLKELTSSKTEPGDSDYEWWQRAQESFDKAERRVSE